jgi:polar amino acid transport system substrate-binding protein
MSMSYVTWQRVRRCALPALLAAILAGGIAAMRPAMAQGAPAAAATADSARALVPADIRTRGTLIAGMPLDFEPYNYLDAQNHQVGLDVDVFTAIADVLGLRPEIQRIGFASIIPSVASGRVDVGMSAMAITPVRLKQVSFVRYGIYGNGLIVRKGNPSGVRTTDACGHSIAVEKGTQPLTVWTTKSQECKDAGKPAINLLVFDGEGPQVLAVESGRADAAGVGYATALVAIQHGSGQLDAAPGGPVPGASSDSGISFSRDREQLGRAIEAALQVLVANGRYKAIFDKWSMSDSTTTPQLSLTIAQ